ncbi:hypothetical protein TNCV_1927271 [Trichonephila clavipes]|nr:hypothetical protein TNCV_1927271 [Trichonephila clavipes]
MNLYDKAQRKGRFSSRNIAERLDRNYPMRMILDSSGQVPERIDSHIRQIAVAYHTASEAKLKLQLAAQ